MADRPQNMPDGLLNLAADAIRRYDWDHGISANPDIGEHQRGEAAAVLAAVLPAARKAWFVELFGDPEKRNQEPATVDDHAALVGRVEDWRVHLERQARERVAERIEAAAAALDPQHVQTIATLHRAARIARSER